ncbi:hypothetical protein EDC01DRAFT_635361 [Geopyxis carbonaria]|nr:hypothetical protein EDC01DRAFT_635361 [Geopyxis carbonaria]
MHRRLASLSAAPALLALAPAVAISAPTGCCGSERMPARTHAYLIRSCARIASDNHPSTILRATATPTTPRRWEQFAVMLLRCCCEDVGRWFESSIGCERFRTEQATIHDTGSRTWPRGIGPVEPDAAGCQALADVEPQLRRRDHGLCAVIDADWEYHHHQDHHSSPASPPASPSPAQQAPFSHKPGHPPISSISSSHVPDTNDNTLPASLRRINPHYRRDYIRTSNLLLAIHPRAAEHPVPLSSHDPSGDGRYRLQYRKPESSAAIETTDTK